MPEKSEYNVKVVLSCTKGNVDADEKQVLQPTIMSSSVQQKVTFEDSVPFKRFTSLSSSHFVIEHTPVSQ